MKEVSSQAGKNWELRDGTSALLKMMYPVPTRVFQSRREILIDNLAVNIVALRPMTWQITDIAFETVFRVVHNTKAMQCYLLMCLFLIDTKRAVLCCQKIILKR
jgi:hypothetical protein